MLEGQVRLAKVLAQERRSQVQIDEPAQCEPAVFERPVALVAAVCAITVPHSEQTPIDLAFDFVLTPALSRTREREREGRYSRTLPRPAFTSAR